MTNQWLQHILHQVIKTVARAGVLLAQEYVRPGGRRGSGAKADIDIEIEMLLRAELLALFECDWLGEETGHVLTGHPFCSVVDPNDGTSDFLRGLKGSALSVGLVHDSKPVLGVVHAPVTPSGVSDSIAWAKGMWHLIRNGQRISVDLSNQNLFETSMLMVSAAADSKSEINKELCAPAEFHAMPSIAYRLARVAAGDGICGISLYPVGAHDVVAGHALLIGAKGVLVGDDGSPARYATEYSMSHFSKRVFGGAPLASADLITRQWNKVLQERSRNPLAT
jgi:fructose-1,6-bisphosphatase/inositol monophosphatase family enzyme